MCVTKLTGFNDGLRSSPVVESICLAGGIWWSPYLPIDLRTYLPTYLPTWTSQNAVCAGRGIPFRKGVSMWPELRQRLERIEGFAWATMMGVREISPAARRQVDQALTLAKTLSEHVSSESGTGTTCETTGRGNGDADPHVEQRRDFEDDVTSDLLK